MKSGVFLPPLGEFGNPRRVAELAARTEEAGWDGFFIWDHILAEPGMPVAEAWTTLAAIAMATTSIRLGPLVTPLPRRRPWTLGRQIGAVDQLSGGRLITGIGLGWDGWREFSSFGEETSPRARGLLLDESLDILLELLSGKPVHHEGSRYVVNTTAMVPGPVQRPVPMWCACEWPNRKPLRRAVRLQGCFPIFPVDDDWPPPPSADDLAAVRAELERLGAPDQYDLVVCAATHRMEPADRAAAIAALPRSGVTWLLERFAPGQPAAEVEAVVGDGPPAP